MIISRTPFRVSLLGGGSDFREYYRESPGAVLTLAINRYMYVTVNKRFDDTIQSPDDIKDILGGWGKATPSLHELATLSGIPGKLDVDGNAVAGLWLDGQLDRIVAYNECDALTTYLVWLRLAHLGGHFDDRAYADEQQRVRVLVEGLIGQGRAHLGTYLTEWDRLSRTDSLEKDGR